MEGVDILAPAFSWTETHYFPAALMIDSFKGILATYRGKTNNAPFKGFATGEVLFGGAIGNWRSQKYDWEVSFKFDSSPNRGSFNVGDIVVSGGKKGWEYMWVEYETKTGVSCGRKIEVPVAVYIEQVYEERNLALLGIGV